MGKALIAINAGSATLKFRAYQPDGVQLLARGLVDRFGAAGASLELDYGGRQTRVTLAGSGRDEAVAAVLNVLADKGLEAVAVAHRVVHGGDRYTSPVVLTPEVVDHLAELIPLAPLHQPASLGVMSAFARLDSKLTQIACFDTAFHCGQPEVATRFGIARHWHEQGIRRYGFHGLSYASIARRLGDMALASQRVVVCHLGSGASACAIHDGRSIASSMGFSAVDGLMMGTRPGNLDPEVVLYWLEHEGMDIAQVRQELYKHSGLLGVSGLSADMRELLASKEPAAKEAIELFCYRAAREVASLATAMKGLDAVVFTAGIGERSPEIRARILKQLSWLGFEVDLAANLARSQRITTPHSARHAYVMATDEEGEMAREAAALLSGDVQL
ncbi:acetate kinase [Vogesella sp. EB]|uniref:acetate/propionate family kinase n=1 Tax=Vogesella TaxID=57739 RepID=UPI00064CE99D|nr:MULTISPECIES: acetate/propionate family kinase [Vogesella]KMJ52501.1 acetate kinase [Vogesella sp. EB]MDC7699155.1 acetate/propionate family kinase [Vogesella indigofera]